MIKEGSVEWGQLVRMIKEHGEEGTLRGLADIFYRRAEKMRKDGTDHDRVADMLEDVADDLCNVSIYP